MSDCIWLKGSIRIEIVVIEDKLLIVSSKVHFSIERILLL